jgi:lipoprotein NlpD
VKALAAALTVTLFVAGCATRSPAPVVDRSARTQAARAATSAPQAKPKAAPDGFYTVKPGDTLYSIALDHGADYRDVAQWNSLDDPTKLSVGQLLRVKPPEERTVSIGQPRILGRIEARPIESAPQQGQGEGSTKTQPQALRLPYSREAADQALPFIWPVKGKILAAFSEPRQKGIDIEGRIGDPVVAAAAGRVTYIGTGIPGLGKLVVIKHDNGFITVYAHNKDIIVKEQQNVARGQKIAEVGASDSGRPKLHFQIRKGSAAVDPQLYLPKL